MRVTRLLLAIAAYALLGLFTSVLFALGVAWARVPQHTFQPDVVASVKLDPPENIGGTLFIANWWAMDDQRKFGERTIAWFAMLSATELNEPVTGRPRFYPAIDAFLDREYLSDVKERSLTRRDVITARAYGWPAYCLWEGETVDGANYKLTDWRWHKLSYGGVEIATSGGGTKYLPTLPLWPGMLLDIFVFACVWGAFFLGPGWLRRALRRRKGLCPQCGYDIRSLSAITPCPECGPSENR